MSVEVVIAAILAALGLRSLVKWFRSDFQPASGREHVLYAVHGGARAGWWFALAGFFVGLTIVERPADFVSFLIVPLALAGIQLVSGFMLSAGERPGRGR